MNALVPYAGALVETDQSELVGLEAEADVLRVEIAEKTRDIEEEKELQSKVETIILAGNNSAHIDNLKLGTEIDNLEMQLLELSNADVDDFDVEAYLEEKAAKENEVPKEPSNKDKKLADKLFKKIAKICHPDKCKNKDLVAIFHEAHEAKLINDVLKLESLVELISKVNSKIKSIRESSRVILAKYVADLKVVLDELNSEYDQLVSGGLAMIADTYRQTGEQGAIKHYEMTLKMSRDNMLQQRDILIKQIQEQRKFMEELKQNEDTLKRKVQETREDYVVEEEPSMSDRVKNGLDRLFRKAGM